MKKNSNTVTFINPVSVEEVTASLPYGYSVSCSVSVSYNWREDYVEVTVTPNKDGLGTGWDSLLSDLVFAYIERHDEVLEEIEYREDGLASVRAWEEVTSFFGA